MTESIQKPRSDLWRILPGILVSLVAVAILLSIIDLDQFASHLKKADFRLLPWAIVIFIVSLICRAMGWRAILDDKITVKRAFWTINEGYLLNNLLPFRLGEVGRAFLVNQTTGIPFWEVIPSIVIERIFDVAFTAGMLIASIPFVIGAEGSQGSAGVVVIVVMLGFITLFLSVRNKELLLSWFDSLSSRIPLLNRFGRERLSSILEGASSLSDPKRFLRVLFWMGSTWALTIGLYYILLIAYEPNAEIVWTTFSLGFLAMGVATPSTPGQIGVYEGVMVLALTLIGMSASLALSYAVVAHAVFLIITLTLGAIGLNRDGASLIDLYKKLRLRKNKA